MIMSNMFVFFGSQIVRKLTNETYVNAVRASILNNPRTNPDYRHYGGRYAVMEDSGTAHINVLAPNGDALAVTSTLND